jgi:hypothetical protein
MPATRRLAFAATHRMINGIHYYAAYMRLLTHPSFPAGFADADIFVLVVAYLANGSHAFNEHLAYFTGRKSYLSIVAFLRHQLAICAG